MSEVKPEVKSEPTDAVTSSAGEEAAATDDKSHEVRLAAIIERTGYSHDITAGQRKYGGPPPGWTGEAPGRGCEIYCGKIPNAVLEDELIPLFEKCGTVWDLRLMMDPATPGLSRGFCFCMFTDPQGAEQAVKLLDGHAIRPNKRLKVNVSNPNSRLFVGNIPKSKSKEDILEEVAKLTEGLQDVIIYTTPDDPKKKNRGFAFLDYDSHKTASSARKRLASGRVRVFGCDVIVDWADPLDEPDTETMAKVKVLYVRNLKSDVTEEQLRERFAAHGVVEKVKKVKDYGFVHFAERDGALKALDALDGTTINDSKMLVSLAKPPTNAKLKEQRKMQHLMLINGGRGPMDPFFGMRGGRAMGGRGGGPGRPMRMPGAMGGARGGAGGPMAYRGMAIGYGMDYYAGGGAGYYDDFDSGDGYYEGYDDYYGGGGGWGGGGYDDYGYYGGGGAMGGGGFGLSGAPRGNNRGGSRGSMGAMRAGMLGGGYGGLSGSLGGSYMRGGSMGGGGGMGPLRSPFGGGRRPFGRGGANGGLGGSTAPRGMKRKAAAGDASLASDTKKPYSSSSAADWMSQPIAQQPLSQGGGAYGSGGESEWYQDSFAGQQWG